MNAAGRVSALVVAIAAFAVLPVFLKSYGVYLCTLFCVTLMATYGLNLTVGYAGQMSLGQAAFYGIGAYIAAIALKAGVPFLVILPVSAVACFVVGLALGFPALRVQHHYLAFATLGFNVLVFLVMRNEEKVTGGTFGISGIPRPTMFGLSLDGVLAFFWFTLFFTVLLIFVLWWLLRSPWLRPCWSRRRIWPNSTWVNRSASRPSTQPSSAASTRRAARCSAVCSSACSRT